MKILGVGLSRTGTLSLHSALESLGLKCIHHDDRRLNDIMAGTDPDPDFRKYDDVDAVTDIPSAYYYRQLIAAYPESKAILTIRDEDDWWRSIERHMNSKRPIRRENAFWRSAHRLGLNRLLGISKNAFRVLVRETVYGSAVAREDLYRAVYRKHNRNVKAEIPEERLLVMNVSAGDGWDTLCRFLGIPKPDKPFPHRNRS